MLRKVKVEKIPIQTSTTAAASGHISENCEPTVDGNETVADGERNCSASDAPAQHPLDEAQERHPSESSIAPNDPNESGRIDFDGSMLKIPSVANGVEPKMPLMSIENELLMCTSDVSKVAGTAPRQSRSSKSDNCNVAADADKVASDKSTIVTNQQRVRAVAVLPAGAKSDQGCKTQ